MLAARKLSSGYRSATLRKIDGKVSTDGEHIVNTVSGELIPDDEPLFLLRARDELALRLLRDYDLFSREAGTNDLHLAGIAQVMKNFAAFMQTKTLCLAYDFIFQKRTSVETPNSI